MNLGLAAAKGEYVGFLNNDIVVSSGWDEGLLAGLDRHELPVVSPVGIERMPTPALTRAVLERWRLVKRRAGPVGSPDDLRAAVSPASRPLIGSSICDFVSEPTQSATSVGGWSPAGSMSTTTCRRHVVSSAPPSPARTQS